MGFGALFVTYFPVFFQHTHLKEPTDTLSLETAVHENLKNRLNALWVKTYPQEAIPTVLEDTSSSDSERESKDLHFLPFHLQPSLTTPQN